MNFWINHFLSAAYYISISTPTYLLLRTLYIFISKQKFDIKKETIMFIFVMYIIALFSQTVLISLPKNFYNIFPLDLRGRINTDSFRVFFDSIRNFKAGNYQYFLINVAGNVIAFIPLGFLSAYLFRKRVFGVVAIGFLTSLLIEIIQLLVIRATDVDDIMLNTLGAFIGYCIYRFIYVKKLKN